MEIIIKSIPYIVISMRDVSLRNHRNQLKSFCKGIRFYAVKQEWNKGLMGEKILLFDGTFVYPALSPAFCQRTFKILRKSDEDTMRNRLRRIKADLGDIEITYLKVKKG